MKMRLWHYELLPYLPDAQFKGQLRELVAIMHDWRDTGKTNHLLINKVMEYPKSELSNYFLTYIWEYKERYGKFPKAETIKEFWAFKLPDLEVHIKRFRGWHNKEYLRVCMANLYEKHIFGVGKSRITDEEWKGYLTDIKTLLEKIMKFNDCTECKHFISCESGKQIFYKISQTLCTEFEEIENGQNKISTTMPIKCGLSKVKKGQI